MTEEQQRACSPQKINHTLITTAMDIQAVENLKKNHGDASTTMSKSIYIYKPPRIQDTYEFKLQQTIKKKKLEREQSQNS